MIFVLTTSVVDARIQGNDMQLRFFLMGVYYLRKYPTEDDLEANSTTATSGHAKKFGVQSSAFALKKRNDHMG
jgi:hypothetical protein